MSKYKVVPVEPAQEAIDAMQLVIDRPYNRSNSAYKFQARHTYKALLTASPDTGMVAVPRELLERIVSTNMADYSVIVYQHKEIRTILEKAND